MNEFLGYENNVPKFDTFPSLDGEEDVSLLSSLQNKQQQHGALALARTTLNPHPHHSSSAHDHDATARVAGGATGVEGGVGGVGGGGNHNGGAVVGVNNNSNHQTDHHDQNQHPQLQAQPLLVRMNSAPTKTQQLQKGLGTAGGSGTQKNNSRGGGSGGSGGAGHRKTNTFPQFPFPKPDNFLNVIRSYEDTDIDSIAANRRPTSFLIPSATCNDSFSPPRGSESPSELQFTRMLSLKDIKSPSAGSSPNPNNLQSPPLQTSPSGSGATGHGYPFFTNNDPQTEPLSQPVSPFGGSSSSFYGGQAGSSDSHSGSQSTSPSPSPRAFPRAVTHMHHRPRSNSTQSTHNYGLRRGRRSRPQQHTRSASLGRSFEMEFPPDDLHVKHEYFTNAIEIEGLLYPPLENLHNGRTPRRCRDKSTIKTRSRSSKTKRKIRKRVAVACVPCNKAKTSCSGERPCVRCVNRSIQEDCIDVIHRKKGRPKKNRAEPDATTLQSDDMVDSTPEPPLSSSETHFVEPRVHQTRNRSKMIRHGSINVPLQKDPDDNEEIMSDVQNTPVDQQGLIQRFKEVMKNTWMKYWTVTQLSSLIVEGTMSPVINFSASLMVQSMSPDEYEYFKSHLFSLFSRLGFSPPPIFELFTFSYAANNTIGSIDTPRNDADDLPVASIICKFLKSSPTHLRVVIKVTKYAEKLLGYSTQDVVDFCANKSSTDLPFFWRLFDESSWSTLMDLEHKAVLGRKREHTCMVTAVSKTGALIQCVATVRYISDDHGIFSSMVICLVPLPGLAGHSISQADEPMEQLQPRAVSTVPSLNECYEMVPELTGFNMPLQHS